MRRNSLLKTGVVCGTAAFIGLLTWTATAQKKATPPTAPSSALFESKIRPLLLQSCVGCHGKEHPQGELRLDVPLSSKMAQEVVRRVKGEGGKPRMPLGAALPKDKIAALEQWVIEGAHWPKGKTLDVPGLMEKGKTHWAFQPVKHPAPPKVKAEAWVRNPIDAFVLANLEAKGLKPSPTATRRELIRRLTYDLTGLPPTPEEVAAFEQDKSPNAYEKVVDRLLASPQYGEKWARHWLDLVRYAETNSYERDNPKPHIHKYRDYVIRAFNEDKPYDRFVREQLAGDEMPNAVGDPLIATAYYRLGIWDDEPADPVQAEFDDLDDLVATTGQAFLGLTLDCARCHDHKLDPIPQQDYYRFVSFFRNINRFKNGGPTDETLYFATIEQKKEYERAVAELAAKRQANLTALKAIEDAYRAKRPQLENANDIAELKYRYFEGAWDKIPDFDALKPVATGTLESNFLALKPRKRDEEIGFVFEGFLNVPQDGEYTFFIDTDDGSRLTVAGKMLLEKGGGGQGMEKSATLSLTAGRVPFRVDYFQGKSPFGLTLAWGGPGFPRRPLSTFESCGAMGLPVLLGAELPLLFDKAKAEEYLALSREKTELDKQVVPVEMVLCVTEKGAKAPETFLLQRGDPHTPGDKVEPGFPVCAGGGKPVIPEPPADAKTTGRRTALADWMTSPDNPLTARVIVNRIWQHHFGRGIVRTPNDFGLQGAPPTHPELLDWLAATFVAGEREEGRGKSKSTQNSELRTQDYNCSWSFKKLHRLILTSNAYKQSSRANPVGLAKDPQNDLFWRFDMRRLNAEEIRDSLLAVSGNINLQMFGEPVYPEIAKEILAGQSRPGHDWYTEKMKPEDVNRRSIYIHVKRSLIYPMLASFDLPETDRPSAARFASTQPTQALTMMNSPLVNKQAEVLAARVRKEAGNEPKAFASRVLALVLQRTPAEAEITESVRLLERLKQRGAKPEQAQTYLCLMALNLDEFFYLD